MLGDLSSLLHRLAEDHRLNQQQAREEVMSMPWDCDGVPIIRTYYYGQRGQDRWSLDFDGYPFATEIETTPWSIFKEPFTRYWVWTDLPKDKVNWLIRKVPEALRADLSPMEEFYPTESGARWNVKAKSLESVCALWKVWEPEFRPKQ